VAEKAYLPTNEIILKAIEEGEREGRPLNVAFSISGVFLEQCEMYGKDVLESFQRLAATGHVEFICQTYYHSLAGFYPTKDEFVQQIKMHMDAIRENFGASPNLFENTEFLYNNAIAREVEALGFNGIFTEGARRILGDRSPNYVYRAKGCERLKVLLRNYNLTDDVAFRFSSRWWVEWPLTADKYARWLGSTPGDCIVIFPDYETFGEHQWPETGIREFLIHLFKEVRKYPNLTMALPSDVVAKREPVDSIDVPEFETISWADIERGTSSWLGNAMQWAYFTALKDQQGLVMESEDPKMRTIWRQFQTSDHLYYMFTAGGAPGEVHSYFNPFGTPMDAFVTCFSALLDFDVRLREETIVANEPFNFHTRTGDEGYTGMSVRSLKGFRKVLQTVSLRSLEFHSHRGDIERWFRFSLKMDSLADEAAKLENLRGRKLREALIALVQRGLESGASERGLGIG
jgi:alpha-amylase